MSDSDDIGVGSRAGGLAEASEEEAVEDGDTRDLSFLDNPEPRRSAEIWMRYFESGRLVEPALLEALKRGDVCEVEELTKLVEDQIDTRGYVHPSEASLVHVAIICCALYESKAFGIVGALAHRFPRSASIHVGARSMSYKEPVLPQVLQTAKSKGKDVKHVIGGSALHLAVQFGSQDLVRTLLAVAALRKATLGEPVHYGSAYAASSQCTIYKANVLEIAIGNDDIEMFELLCVAGDSWNEPCEDLDRDSTALAFAISHEAWTCADAFLEIGSTSLTPFTLEKALAHPDFLVKLTRRFPKEMVVAAAIPDIWRTACFHGVGVLRILSMAFGVDAELPLNQACRKYRMSPLVTLAYPHFAIDEDDALESARFLLEMGADRNWTRPGTGRTAHSYAMEANRIKLAALLKPGALTRKRWSAAALTTSEPSLKRKRL